MTTETLLSLDDFLARPESKPASEWVDGEVKQKPVPNEKHSDLQTYLAFLLMQHCLSTRAGKPRTECRCVFGPPDDVRAYVPDLVVIRAERLSRGPRAEDGPFQGAPDLAVEIVSPHQPAAAFARKITFYLRHGVELVWVVDPRSRSVTVYSAQGEERTLREGEVLEGGAVLPGFPLGVAELFRAME